MNSKSRTVALRIIESMIEDGIVTHSDFNKYHFEKENINSPENIRREFENWYINLGIEQLIKGKLALSLPYFTEEEIQMAHENNEIFLCLPKNISKKVLGKLFNFESWVLDDILVDEKKESSDFWFKMKSSEKSEYLDSQGREIKKIYENQEKLQLTLERYMVFLARMNFLGNDQPDTKTKTWIINSRYEKKSMLIAGFDSNGDFSAHAWMPNFHSPLVGGRYVEIVDHHYI